MDILIEANEEDGHIEFEGIISNFHVIFLCEVKIWLFVSVFQKEKKSTKITEKPMTFEIYKSDITYSLKSSISFNDLSKH